MIKATCKIECVIMCVQSKWEATFDWSNIAIVWYAALSKFSDIIFYSCWDFNLRWVRWCLSQVANLALGRTWLKVD